MDGKDDIIIIYSLLARHFVKPFTKKHIIILSELFSCLWLYEELIAILHLIAPLQLHVIFLDFILFYCAFILRKLFIIVNYK